MTQNRTPGSQLWVTHEVERTEGKSAQAANIAAAKSLAETVRTTLGPNGMDKMVVGSDGTVVVTNDGASILDRIEVTDPTAQTLVETAQGQSGTVGDGTTSVVTVMGALLGEAEDLLESGLHPMTIIGGYRQAADAALDHLRTETIDVDPTDEAELRRVGEAAVTGKWDDESAQYLSELAVQALTKVADGNTVDVRDITLRSVPGGSLRDSETLDGLSIDVGSSSTSIEGFDAHLPDVFESATVALIDAELTIEKADAVSNSTVSDASQLRELQSYEESVRSEAVQRFSELGVDVLFCQKSIDDEIRSRLAGEGILAVERTRQDEMHKIARVTGGALERSVDELSPATVGQVPRIERRPVGPTEHLLISTDVPHSHVSLLLRGGTKHVADETKRVIEDCIAAIQLALQEQSVVPGGGAIEMSIARHLSSYASQVDGREQLVIEAFAEALETIPQTLATSAGLDPVDALVDLRTRHHRGETATGVDVLGGKVANMQTAAVFEPMSVKHYMLTNALEGATMVLRVDDIIAAEHTGEDHDHGHDQDHNHGGVQHAEGYPWAIGH